MIFELYTENLNISKRPCKKILSLYLLEKAV